MHSEFTVYSYLDTLIIIYGLFALITASLFAMLITEMRAWTDPRMWALALFWSFCWPVTYLYLVVVGLITRACIIYRWLRNAL
jgi:hypothetical protein